MNTKQPYRRDLKKDREASARYRQRHPERAKQSATRSELNRKYKLSLNDIAAMRCTQQDSCAACGDLFGSNSPYIDHNHKCCPGRVTCGKCIRGLLCSSCNFALGHLKDNPERAMKLVAYLEKYA